MYAYDARSQYASLRRTARYALQAARVARKTASLTTNDYMRSDLLRTADRKVAEAMSALADARATRERDLATWFNGHG